MKTQQQITVLVGKFILLKHEEQEVLKRLAEIQAALKSVPQRRLNQAFDTIATELKRNEKV